MGTELWLCGKYISGNFPEVVWDFQGIFSTRDNAIEACRDESYFICSVKLDEQLSDEAEEMPDFAYPFLVKKDTRILKS